MTQINSSQLSTNIPNKMANTKLPPIGSDAKRDSSIGGVKRGNASFLKATSGKGSPTGKAGPHKKTLEPALKPLNLNTLTIN